MAVICFTNGWIGLFGFSCGEWLIDTALAVIYYLISWTWQCSRNRFHSDNGQLFSSSTIRRNETMFRFYIKTMEIPHRVEFKITQNPDNTRKSLQIPITPNIFIILTTNTRNYKSTNFMNAKQPHTERISNKNQINLLSMKTYFEFMYRYVTKSPNVNFLHFNRFVRWLVVFVVVFFCSGKKLRIV